MKYHQVNSDVKYLNLGCGYRYDSRWTNVNFVSTGQDVMAYDLTKGIPFPDHSFELVYHSHVLEHFPKTLAKSFLQECYRVLQPQGILRVVVPDLEQIARVYLSTLDRVSSSPESAANYEWISLELLDQLVRNSRGGEMMTYLSQPQISNKQFITERFGTEAEHLWQSEPRSDRPFKGILKEIRQFSLNLQQSLPKPLNKLYKALKIGYYRQNGEVHQWMYDRYSLSVLLAECGLEQIKQRTATDSYLTNWASLNLDTEANGKVYKPDSLFMEGLKPEQ